MANTFNVELNCTNVTVSPNGNRTVTVNMEDVEKSDVMDLFDAVEFLDHFGQDTVIGEIDTDKLEAWAESNGYVKQD